MKLPSPRRFKAWLVALGSLTAVALVSIAPMMRPRAQPSIPTYTFTDLGTLGTGTESRARGINDCGIVVGESNLVPTGQLRPFIWSAGVMKDVAPGASSGTAAAINSSGFVTGTVDGVAYIWHDDNGNGTPDSNERFSLGTLPSDVASDGLDINDAQQVVGLSGDNGTQERGFSWQQGVMQAIPTDNGITPIWGTGVNNAGHIVGPGSTASSTRAYLRKGSSTIDLKSLGGNSFAHDVNEAGYVVGLSGIAAHSGNHAFIWRDANDNGITDGGCEPLTAGCEIKDLGTLGGLNSAAYDINANNIIVGSSDVSGGAVHAFVYDGTTMHDLNSSGVVTNLTPGWVLVRANAINAGGQIVGYGTTPGGDTHAFLLTPTGFTPPQCQSASPTVNVSVSPASVTEDGVGLLTYTFTRSIVTASSLTVNFSVGGTADPSTDYSQTGASFTPPTGTVTFAGSSATAIVTVDPVTDSAVEINETVELTITADAGYTVGAQNVATGTITNDDLANVSVAVSPSAAAEDGAANLVYTFTRNSTIGSLTVNFSVGGTAGFSSDYGQTGAATFTASTGTVTFTAGSTQATVTIDPSTDTTVESDETVILTIAADPAYTVGGPSSATGTITNDDLANVSVAVAPSSVAEDGADNLVYTFTRSSTAGSLTVAFAVGGTALYQTDYEQTGATSFVGLSPTGTVTFLDGSPTATVTVNPNTDTTVEPDETVILILTTRADYTVGSPSSATGTITNDDSLPGVSVAVSPAATAEDGAANLVYTFTRTGSAANALTVNFSVGGTAGFSSDYGQTGAATFTASTGTVTFTAGNTQATVTLDPTADTTDEPDETVILTLTADAAYTVGSSSSATGTITNDDAPMVQLGQSTFTVIEDSQVATITVTRSGDTSNAATVKYSTSDIAGLQSCTLANTMASERCDYTTAVGRVTFAPAETSKTFTVPIVNDVWVEGNETFFVNLSNPVGASLGSQATSTVEITDNDFAAPTSNPIFGVEYFIRALYRDILNRQPDSTGLQNWIDTLTPCPNGGFGEPPTSNCDRLHIAAGFFQSDEYLNRGYWAFRFYMVSFNQRPTYAQFIPDLSEVGGPKSPAEEEVAKIAYADAFVQRPAFLANYSGLSGQALADALTQKTGLPPFTVTAGMTNGQILRAIAERQTSLDKFLTEGTVSILYFGFQRRDPDAIGYQNNVDTLNANPNNLRHMIFIFIYSTEYLNRFGPQ